MDNQDNLFNKIKSAAENAETKEFPGMEKVWSRIDAKLDTKVEKKQNNNWTKLMIAASVITLITIGYQLLKVDEQLINPSNEVVKEEIKSKIITPQLHFDTNAVVITNPLIKENKSEILSKQLNSAPQVSSNYTLSKSEDAVRSDSVTLVRNGSFNTASSNATYGWTSGRKFDSRGVTNSESDKIDYKVTVKEDKNQEQKIAPIILVDGQIVNKDISSLDDEEIETIIDLKEPLYIINGIYYTEKELFGPEPTSPYAPLKKQKIETISVLEPEKAVTIYGEKGKKGIVIVTTKDGKPILQKKE
ncbi:hypothetical protein OX283_004730 [Flavobacterium sp. SUN052]|uniref:hypothetical protein n=1 Tax=Flavobacterium sp. SUN052 TaxID=3002441 RepID=UPI00237DEC44|nr:hypothetical protein [Flavobacterium sp. SUN052]MEC4003951.1 hypothetical protein [Flavobacterium sp. SUN052]